MGGETHIYGMLAEYVKPEDVLSAARKAAAEGYTKTDAFTPFPVDGLAEAVGMRKNRVGLATLLGGIAGGAFAYFLLYYVNVIDYPMNVGGRPYHSWPSFIPITFEATILVAALGAVLAMLILNRLPELYHPVFNGDHFERASQDRFFLVIEATDPRFDVETARAFLAGTGADHVSPVTYTGEAALDEPGARRAEAGGPST